LISCDHSRFKNVERISLTPEIVSEGLETSMPGQLAFSDNYLIWANPFNSDMGIHIVDKVTGDEITRAVERGSGPDELISPTVVETSMKDIVLVYDFDKRFLMSLHNLDREYLSFPENIDLGSVTRIIPEENKTFILFNPEQTEPFLLTDMNTNQSYTFGKAPHDNDEDRYSAFQGTICHHPTKKVLVYSTSNLPYMAIYTKKDEKYVLSKEILFEEDSERGISEMALTKDYIVTLERDLSIDQTDPKTVGRDINKLPRTIFLYTYDLKLKQIINLGMPVIRLSADPSTNTVYAITVNPEFNIVKFDI